MLGLFGRDDEFDTARNADAENVMDGLHRLGRPAKAEALVVDVIGERHGGQAASLPARTESAFAISVASVP